MRQRVGFPSSSARRLRHPEQATRRPPIRRTRPWCRSAQGLAPVQVLGIPVASEFDEYLGEILATLHQRGIRTELDTSDDRFGKKIRNAQKQKVPFMLIAGGDDRDAGSVSFRYRDGSQRNGVPRDQAVDEIVAFVASRVNEGPSADA